MFMPMVVFDLVIGGKPCGDFVIGNDLGLGSIGYAGGICDVIEVTMRNQDKVGLCFFGLDGRRRVVVEKGVEQYSVLARFNGPGSVPKPSQFGCHAFLDVRLKFFTPPRRNWFMLTL